MTVHDMEKLKSLSIKLAPLVGCLALLLVSLFWLSFHYDALWEVLRHILITAGIIGGLCGALASMAVLSVNFSTKDRE